MIKKILCVIMSLILIFLLCSCGGAVNNSEISFEQKLTIYYNEENQTKVSKNLSDVEKMISVLGDINKLETIDDWIGSCDYEITITVDGQDLIYKFGGKTFCDVDGILYKVKNADEIRDKIEKIFNNIS